jgi:hypothetical protein
MEEITGDEYSVVYDPEAAAITLEGSLRLQGIDEYEPITRLLDRLGEHERTELTLNLQDLKFLNSSGINILCRFVIKMRKQGTHQITVLGSNHFPWQGKSLKNLERLMPGLKLELE